MKAAQDGNLVRARPLMVDARGVCREFLGASPVELDYAETANDAIVITTTNALLFTSPNSIYIDGHTRVLLEWFMNFNDGQFDTYLQMLDNGVSTIWSYEAFVAVPFRQRFVYTPAAGWHKYAIWGNAGDSRSVPRHMGGGGGTYAPSYIRVSAL